MNNNEVQIIKQTTPEQIIKIQENINKLNLSNEDIELIYDTETTGFSPVSDYIVEFGMLIVNKKTKSIIDTIHFYTNPFNNKKNKPKYKEVPEDTFKIHNINKTFLEGQEFDRKKLDKPALTFEDYSQVISNFITGKRLVAHNAQYDNGMLEGEFKRSGIHQRPEELANSVIDTLTLFRIAIPKEELLKLDLPTKYNLNAFLEYTKKISDNNYKIDRTYHGAITDSYMLYESYKVLIKNKKVQELIEDINKERGDVEQKNNTINTRVLNKDKNYYFKTDADLKEGAIDIEKLMKEFSEKGITSATIMDTLMTTKHPTFKKLAEEYNVKAQFGSQFIVKIENKEINLNVIIKDNIGLDYFNKLISKAYENSKEEPFITKEDLIKQDLSNLILSFPIENEEDYKNVSLFNFINKNILYIEPKVKIQNNSSYKINNTETLKYNENELEEAEILKQIVNGDNFDEKLIENTNSTIGKQNDLNNNIISFNYPEKTSIFPKLPLDINYPEELTAEQKKEYRHKIILDLFIKEAQEGFNKRVIDNNYEGEELEKLKKRLEGEINVILSMENDQNNTMAFAEYFLIVQNYVQWAKNNGVLVGPGRGSGAGSLIAYSMNIIEIEVQKFNLLFERFINPERISEPDFDVDFAGIVNINKDIKDIEVKKYVKELYPNEETIDGKELIFIYMKQHYKNSKVAKILTEGKLQAKSVIADIIKTMGDNKVQILFDNNPELKAKLRLQNKKIVNQCRYVDLSNYLKSLINDKKTLQENITDNQDLEYFYNHSNMIRQILKMGLSLENKIKTFGAHAGGVVIDNDSTQPIGYINNEPVYLKTMSDTELIKFDFLGLKTLEVIKEAEDLVLERYNTKINWNKIDYKDKETIKLMSEGNTKGIFQFESKGMQEMLKKAQVESFEDLVNLVALYRPGPMGSGMLKDYIERANNSEIINYYFNNEKFKNIEHILKPLLSETKGVVIFQEQIMKMVQDLAGFSLGEADLIRRAMGKKSKQIMEEQSNIFATKANIYLKEKYNIDFSIEDGKELFKIIEQFAGYGFNKSHSVAYADVSYKTAYLKTHYKTDFYQGLLNTKIKDVDKIGEYIKDAKHNNIEIVEPNINISNKLFSITIDNKIIYGLQIVKGIGEEEVKKIIEEREANGEFETITELLTRTFLKKNTMESLILSGACDNLETLSDDKYQNRKLLLEKYYDLELGKKKKTAKSSRKEINGSRGEFFKIEKDLMGTPITLKNKIEEPEVQIELNKNQQTFGNLENNKIFNINAVISKIRKIKTKAGKDMGFITMSDGKTEVEAMLFDNLINKMGDNLKENELFKITGKLQQGNNGFEDKIVISNLKIINTIKSNITENNKKAENQHIFEDNGEVIKFFNIKNSLIIDTLNKTLTEGIVDYNSKDNYYQIKYKYTDKELEQPEVKETERYIKKLREKILKAEYNIAYLDKNTISTDKGSDLEKSNQKFKNYHTPNNWYYEEDNITYIKVGAYGIDDLEYLVQEDGSIYLPQLNKYYTTLEKAYEQENQQWTKAENKLNDNQFLFDNVQNLLDNIGEFKNEEIKVKEIVDTNKTTRFGGKIINIEIYINETKTLKSVAYGKEAEEILNNQNNIEYNKVYVSGKTIEGKNEYKNSIVIKNIHLEKQENIKEQIHNQTNTQKEDLNDLTTILENPGKVIFDNIIIKNIIKNLTKQNKEYAKVVIKEKNKEYTFSAFNKNAENILQNQQNLIGKRVEIKGVVTEGTNGYNNSLLINEINSMKNNNQEKEVKEEQYLKNILQKENENVSLEVEIKNIEAKKSVCLITINNNGFLHKAIAFKKVAEDILKNKEYYINKKINITGKVKAGKDNFPNQIVINNMSFKNFEEEDQKNKMPKPMDLNHKFNSIQQKGYTEITSNNNELNNFFVLQTTLPKSMKDLNDEKGIQNLYDFFNNQENGINPKIIIMEEEKGKEKETNFFALMELLNENKQIDKILIPTDISNSSIQEKLKFKKGWNIIKMSNRTIKFYIPNNNKELKEIVNIVGLSKIKKTLPKKIITNPIQ